MKNKLKIIIPIVTAIVAVIIALVCVSFKPQNKADMQSVLQTAQKYLTELNYEQAIAEFEKSIQIDPRNVDAYIGIAQAYELMGDTEKALEWLQKGFDLTGDPAIKVEIDRLGGSAEAEVTTEQTAEETTTTPTEETTAVETNVTENVEKYTDEELTEVLKQLIENPDAEIEQDKLDAIKCVNIVGKDFIYAGREYYGFGITSFSPGDGETFSLEIDGTWNEFSYGTHSDLSFISKLKNVENICVDYNQISDISALHNMTCLKSLSLRSNQISDIRILNEMTELKSLYLNNNQISNISILSNLINLQYLGLDYNQISDISALTGLTNLKSLSLWNNQISESDIEALKISLPNCDVEG